MAVLEGNLVQVDKIMSVLMVLSDLAEQECWDDLLLAWPSYDQATANLPQINWSEFSCEEKEDLSNRLVILQETHDRLIIRMLDFRSELKDLLHNSIQSRKLNDHYR
ncbi:hypothetical protein [uncultured Deefgea sp.]|uniref:hypothetical protein n=1 Tax=uncultured Deefgea sp. TaxID=1304914 RepID=UPI002597D5E0|nr:hypothetical protein [uncultured Deefgea sp.]